MTTLGHLWQHPASMKLAHITFGLMIGSLAMSTLGCEGKLDANRFRRRAEKSYMKANAGWTIKDRRLHDTVFVRGDQLDVFDVDALFAEYQKSGKSGSDFLEAWSDGVRAQVEARRRTLNQAKDEFVPIIKSGSWVSVQDLGAIGPKRMQDKIRPWRKKIASDVYMVLGIPEEKLGYRFASIHEVKTFKDGEKGVYARAIANLEKQIKVDEISGVEMNHKDGRLLVIDLANEDGVSGLILSPRFRQRMLTKFNLTELGASVPIRKVLIVFDPADFVTIKPIRHRTHQLYDTQNHPGFRGLLKLDKEGVGILEPANPKKKAKPKP